MTKAEPKVRKTSLDSVLESAVQAPARRDRNRGGAATCRSAAG